MRMILLTVITCFMIEAAPRPLQRVAFSSDEVVTVDVDRVNLQFSVRNRKGKLITNLKREHFNIFEDDQLQSITNFSTETDLPLNIALLFDSSGSLHDKLRFEQNAAAQFLYSSVRRGRDQALIMTFDTTISLLHDYTDDPAILVAAMQKIILGGSTSLYDAVCEAATEKLARQAERRVIVIISDGMDNTSHVSLAKTIELVQKSDVVIYAVSTNRFGTSISPEQKMGDAVLTQLATETGGQALFPARVEDLVHCFARISEDLRSQYSLAYRPTNARRDGTYRQIRIVTPNNRHTVRSRSGYFAPGP